jgi:hypothetical protein
MAVLALPAVEEELVVVGSLSCCPSSCVMEQVCLVATCCLLVVAAAGCLWVVVPAGLVAAGVVRWRLVPEVVLLKGADCVAAGLLLMVAAAMVVGVCR